MKWVLQREGAEPADTQSNFHPDRNSALPESVLKVWGPEQRLRVRGKPSRCVPARSATSWLGRHLPVSCRPNSNCDRDPVAADCPQNQEIFSGTKTTS